MRRLALSLLVLAFALLVGACTSSSAPKPHPSPSTAAPCSATVGGHDRPYEVELACAMQIPGVRFHLEPHHLHVATTVQYDTSPPVGGDHANLWANCQGTIYTEPIADENAVHMLEHGAVWVTYNPATISPGDLAAVKTDVAGVAFTALSPYAGLKTPISLQAWGYQLFVDHATDPRIERFITLLRHNRYTTPEFTAGCADPYFEAQLSRPGHPEILR